MTLEQAEKNDKMFTIWSSTVYTNQINPILVQSLGLIKTVFTVDEKNILIKNIN